MSRKEQNYQATVVYDTAEATDPPLPPAEAPPAEAPPAEDGANGETQPLVGGVVVEGAVDEGSSDRHKTRAALKRLLPWLGLALIVFAVVLAVCIVVLTSGRKHRRNTDEYGVVVKQYADAVKHNVKSNLNSKSTSPDVAPGCEATVIVMRHCDKSGNHKDDAGDEHCGYLGYERARYLSTLFGDSSSERWPAPSWLYAMSPHRRLDLGHKLIFRQMETLGPLSEKIGVAIHSDYVIGDESKLAHKIYSELRSGRMCGKVALVSWRQPDIPTLAQKLGCGPYNGCPMHWDESDIESMWQIRYAYAPLRPKVSQPGLETTVSDASATTTQQPKQQQEPTVPDASATTTTTTRQPQQQQEPPSNAGPTEPAAPADEAPVERAGSLRNLKTKKAKDGTKTVKDKAKAVKNKAKKAKAAAATHKGKKVKPAAAMHTVKALRPVTQALSPRPEVPLVWEVHGAAVRMDFDPLAFSKRVGDYPEGGAAEGGRWVV